MSLLESQNPKSDSESAEGIIVAFARNTNEPREYRLGRLIATRDSIGVVCRLEIPPSTEQALQAKGVLDSYNNLSKWQQRRIQRLCSGNSQTALSVMSTFKLKSFPAGGFVASDSTPAAAEAQGTAAG